MSDAEHDALATVTRAAGSTKPRAETPARLRVVWPPELTWTLPLGRTTLVVGRTASEEGVPALRHETVSRRHLELSWDRRQHAHLAADLGSHNGSRVDGAEIGQARRALTDGTVLQLGDVCVIYERGPGLAADIRAAGEAVSTDNIPGDAPAVLQVRAAIGRAAPDPSPVLLLGETGTGKEWLARELHRLSQRPGPMVAINCSALSPQIVDSQLFGHVKGAFTGATTDHPGMFRAADGGTLFLDEIGDLPLELQPKLLRALQEGEVQPVGSAKLVPVDVRVIAATNHQLAAQVEAGQFRRDLYARLALWEIPVPPLRERRGDLLDWIARLHSIWVAQRPHQANEHAPLTFAAEAAEGLLLHSWPNNLREVDRLVHDLASDPTGERPISLPRLPPWLRTPPDSAAPATSGAAAGLSGASVRSQTAPQGSAPGGAAATPHAGAKTPTAKPPVPTAEEFTAVFDELEGNVRAMAKHFARDRRQIYRWIESFGLADRRKKGDR